MESPSQKQKLWLDDVRPNPEGWTWVKNLHDAKEQILAWHDAGDEWTHASLDHDLGADLATMPLEGLQLLIARGDSPEGSGYDLVEWMCDEGHLPTEAITIHSWNYSGAERMAFLLKRFVSYPIEVKPYVLP